MIPRQELIPLDEPTRWDEALRAVSHAHGHTWSHVAAFQRATGHTTFLFVQRDERGHVAVVCPLAVRGRSGECDVYTPYGFSGFATTGAIPNFLEDWDRFATAQGWVATYALQHPAIDQVFDTPLTATRTVGECYVVDLQPQPATILDAMSTRRRAQLRRWERDAVPLTRDVDQLRAFFTAQAASFFARRQASDVYALPDETWSALLGSASVLGMGVREGSTVVAASIFGFAGGTADFLFGLSVPGAEAYSAPLIWEAIKSLHDRDVTVLNLGGGIRTGDGVAEFKRRFGATAVPLTSLCMVHRDDAFQDLCRRARIEDDGPDDFFPPYRKVSP